MCPLVSEKTFESEMVRGKNDKIRARYALGIEWPKAAQISCREIL